MFSYKIVYVLIIITEKVSLFLAVSQSPSFLKQLDQILALFSVHIGLTLIPQSH